jgi:hypothetical protein
MSLLDKSKRRKLVDEIAKQFKKNVKYSYYANNGYDIWWNE